MTFYEIDAAILSVALDDQYFHYLKECAPDSQTILGDARLSLAVDPDRQFDLLIIDAFSSDSIPVHLITREAIDLYLETLADDGLLLIHISNRYMDLEPVLGNLSQHANLAGRIQRFFPVEKDPEADPEVIAAETRNKLLTFRFPSTWVVLARNEQALGEIATDQRWSQLNQSAKVGLWTDDYSNIVRVLQWGKKVTSD